MKMILKNEIRQSARALKKSNEGLSLVELVVTSLIMGMVSLIIVLFVSASRNSYTIVNNEVTNAEMKEAIKKSAGRILDSVNIFDIYENIEEGKKSMAYKLVFKDETRTLSDEEVMVVFNKVIKDIETKFDAKLRNQ